MQDRLVELDIFDITREGKGVGKKDNFTYFVSGAMIGQKLLANVTKIKKNYCEANLHTIIKESPYKENSLCKHSSVCDGCSFQDINYDKQKEIKKAFIINSINRLAGEKIEDIKFTNFDRYNYRNKVELKLDIEGNLSYFSRKTNENVAVDQCIIANKRINEIISFLQECIRRFNIQGFNPETNEGLIKNIVIRSTSVGESMLILVLSKSQELDFPLQSLASSGLLDSIYISVNPKKNNYKIDKLELVYGKDKIKEVMGDKTFLISPKSFFQVNTKTAYEIYSKARAYVEKIKPKQIIDLYSGISTTSIIMSDLVEKIYSVEIVKDAVLDGIENAKLNQVANIDFICQPAEDFIESQTDFQKDAMLLVDPPRKGLDPLIIQKIGKSHIKHIVYISCDPATLARDIRLFKEYGFVLEEIEGFDMFLNTLHVEALTLLSRD